MQRVAPSRLASGAGCTMLLAIVGVYGVLSYLATQRTSEISIRMALGAQPSHVLRQVVGEGGKLLAAGIVGGVLGSLVTLRILGALLFEVKPTDPLTFALAAVALALTAMLASYLPARRASRVDPMSALRYE